MSEPNATEIYGRLKDGDAVASGQMFELVYGELKRLAHDKLRQESADQSLQTTALVNEAYVRLVGTNQDWQGRAHFFAAAAEAMRRILVERARARSSLKRGHGWTRIELEDPHCVGDATPSELLAVHEIFDRLDAEHPVEAEIAKLRYFAGFNATEAARVLDIPVSSAHRYWRFARAWLIRELKSSDRQA